MNTSPSASLQTEDVPREKLSKLTREFRRLRSPKDRLSMTMQARLEKAVVNLPLSLISCRDNVVALVAISQLVDKLDKDEEWTWRQLDDAWIPSRDVNGPGPSGDDVVGDAQGDDWARGEEQGQGTKAKQGKTKADRGGTEAPQEDTQTREGETESGHKEDEEGEQKDEQEGRKEEGRKEEGRKEEGRKEEGRKEEVAGRGDGDASQWAKDARSGSAGAGDRSQPPGRSGGPDGSPGTTTSKHEQAHEPRSAQAERAREVDFQRILDAHNDLGKQVVIVVSVMSPLDTNSMLGFMTDGAERLAKINAELSSKKVKIVILTNEDVIPFEHDVREARRELREVKREIAQLRSSANREVSQTQLRTEVLELLEMLFSPRELYHFVKNQLLRHEDRGLLAEPGDRPPREYTDEVYEFLARRGLFEGLAERFFTLLSNELPLRNEAIQACMQLFVSRVNDHTGRLGSLIEHEQFLEAELEDVKFMDDFVEIDAVDAMLARRINANQRQSFERQRSDGDWGSDETSVVQDLRSCIKGGVDLVKEILRRGRHRGDIPTLERFLELRHIEKVALFAGTFLRGLTPDGLNSVMRGLIELEPEIVGGQPFRRNLARQWHTHSDEILAACALRVRRIWDGERWRPAIDWIIPRHSQQWRDVFIHHCHYFSDRYVDRLKDFRFIFTEMVGDAQAETKGEAKTSQGEIEAKRASDPSVRISRATHPEVFERVMALQFERSIDAPHRHLGRWLEVIRKDVESEMVQFLKIVVDLQPYFRRLEAILSEAYRQPELRPYVNDFIRFFIRKSDPSEREWIVTVVKRLDAGAESFSAVVWFRDLVELHGDGDAYKQIIQWGVRGRLTQHRNATQTIEEWLQHDKNRGYDAVVEIMRSSMLGSRGEIDQELERWAHAPSSGAEEVERQPRVVQWMLSSELRDHSAAVISEVQLRDVMNTVFCGFVLRRYSDIRTPKVLHDARAMFGSEIGLLLDDGGDRKWLRHWTFMIGVLLYWELRLAEIYPKAYRVSSVSERVLRALPDERSSAEGVVLGAVVASYVEGLTQVRSVLDSSLEYVQIERLEDLSDSKRSELMGQISNDIAFCDRTHQTLSQIQTQIEHRLEHTSESDDEESG